MHPENTGALHWSGVYMHIVMCIIEGSLNLKDVFHALNIEIHLLTNWIKVSNSNIFALLVLFLIPPVIFKFSFS